VGERRVNRDAWARVVSELVASETRGKIAPFARRVGVDPRTVSRWLRGEVDVSEESVREVARQTGRNPAQLLVDVGYYRLGEISIAQSQSQHEHEHDEEMQIILSAPVDDQTKRLMIERLLALRERDKQRRIEDLRWHLDRRAGA